MSLAKQKGMVLLASTLLLVMIFSAGLLVFASASKKAEDAIQNTKIFNTAKNALIGYALSYPEFIGNAQHVGGLLPCPDFTGDGLADAPCNGSLENSIGRLPWQTLGIQPLRDSSGECLWYVVSGRFKEDLIEVPSSNSEGGIVLESLDNTVLIGSVPSQNAIAVMIAPGAAIGNQQRFENEVNKTVCGSVDLNANVNNPANYMESFNGINNSTGQKVGVLAGEPGYEALPTVEDSAFISGIQQNVNIEEINDRIYPIQPKDFKNVFLRMNLFVANKVRDCMVSYGLSSGQYPWAAVLNAVFPAEYNDDTGQRFGRIPEDLSSTFASNASMSLVWPLDPQDASVRCFEWDWWPVWREQVFYAVNQANTPVSGSDSGLTVNASSSEFAIIVAGRVNATQVRELDSDKGAIENYLEGENIPGLGSGQLPGGDEVFLSSSLDSSSDIVCSSSVCYN